MSRRKVTGDYYGFYDLYSGYWDTRLRVVLADGRYRWTGWRLLYIPYDEHVNQ